MKFILVTLALFAAAITALHAADPVVIVVSATSVTVDGADYGRPADAIANNRQLAPLIQVALEKWAAEQTAAKAEAEAELVALRGRISSTLTSMLNEELKTGEGPRTALLRNLIAEASKTENDLKREALEAEIAAKQRELDAIK